ncbi:MAG: hypothetical protein KF746_04015 [Chitinophagaceae bacterium]|nr:hypothetical protein [Chitinophagaceae bacterium]
MEASLRTLSDNFLALKIIIFLSEEKGYRLQVSSYGLGVYGLRFIVYGHNNLKPQTTNYTLLADC